MMEKIKANPQKNHFLLYFIAFGIYGAVIVVPGPVIPFMAQKYDLPETSFTFMFWTRGTGFILGGLLTKILAKHFSYHHLMSYSSIGIGLIFIIFPFTFSVPLQGLEVLLANNFCSTFQIVIFMCFLEAFKGNEEEYWLQISMVSFGFFALLTPMLAGITGEMCYFYVGIFALVVSIGFFLLPTPESLKHEHLGQNHEEQMGIKVVSRKAEILLGMMFFFYYAEETGFSGWIASYSVIKNIYQKQGSAFLVALFWFSIAAFRLIYAGFSGTIYDKLLYLFYMRGIFFFFIIALERLGFSQLAVLFGCVSIGIAYSSTYSLVYALPLQYKRKLIPSQTANIVICGTFGQAVLTTFQGVLIRRFGVNIFFPYLALLALANFFLLLILKRQLSSSSSIPTLAPLIEELNQMNKKQSL